MNNLIIEKVNAEAIPLIQELTMKVWPQTYSSVLSEEQIAYMMDMMYSKESLMKQMQTGQQFVIAFYNNQPIGFASYGITEIPNEFKLHKLYVITSVQKTGAGKSLLWYVMYEIKKAGANHLMLQVNRQNENAINFYKRMGFTIEQQANFDIGSGYFMNDYVMGISFTN